MCVGSGSGLGLGLGFAASPYYQPLFTATLLGALHFYISRAVFVRRVVDAVTADRMTSGPATSSVGK